MPLFVIVHRGPQFQLFPQLCKENGPSAAFLPMWFSLPIGTRGGSGPEACQDVFLAASGPGGDLRFTDSEVSGPVGGLGGSMG